MGKQDKTAWSSGGRSENDSFQTNPDLEALPPLPPQRPASLHRARWVRSSFRTNPHDFSPPPHRPAGAAALPIPKPPLVPAIASPRVLDGSPLVLPLRIGKIDAQFLRTELPALNNAVSVRALSVGDFAEVIRCRLSASDLEAFNRIAPRLSPKLALYALGGLGAIASSAVRHVRVQTGDPDSSAGLHLFPGLEGTLVALGDITGRAPRDNQDTAWALGLPATFTGSEGELRFGHAVREANRLLGANDRVVMPIRSGDVCFADAVELFDEATKNVKEYALVQSDLIYNAFPADFLAMRSYLGSYVVGGVKLEGPNATYSAGWTGFEVSLGLLDGFRATALRRTRFMSFEDREHIEASCQIPTLCEIVAESLGLARKALEPIDPREFGFRFKAAAPSLQRAILAVRALAKATAQMAATHVGTIKKNLTEPVSKIALAERERLGVSPEGGVSGTPLQHTFEQGARRMRHPLIRMPVSGDQLESGQ